MMPDLRFLILWALLAAAGFLIPRVLRPAEPSPRALRVTLAAILFVALGLRFLGLGWGIPSLDLETARAVPGVRCSYHMDEDNYFRGLLRVRPKSLDFYVSDYHWGTLQFYLVETALLGAQAVGWLPSPWRDAFTDAPPLYFPRLFMAGRVVSALLGGLSVLAVFALGRALWGPRSGLAGALALAILPFHVIHSHFLTSDVTLCFLLTCSLGQLLASPQGPSPRSSLVSGAAFGLACAAKYNAVFLLPAVLAAQLRAPAGFLRNLLLWTAAAAFGFLLGSPYCITHFPEFWAALERDYLSTVTLPPGSVPSAAQLAFIQFRGIALYGLGLPLLVSTSLGARGLLQGDSRRWPYAIAIGGFVISLELIRQPMLRYTLPALILGMAAVGASLAHAALQTRRRLAATVLLGLTAISCGLQLQNLLLPHTANLAVQWIGRHVPPGSSIRKGWPEIPVLNSNRYSVSNFFTRPKMADLREFFLDDSGALSLPDFVLTDNLPLLEIPVEYLQTLQTRYDLATEFTSPPRIGPWILPEPDAPHDWKYTHPEIRIYRRRAAP